MGVNETGGRDADNGKGEGARTRGSGSESVYKALRHEILTMERAPGSPLDETRLSEHFGMSRTPIREALLRLTALIQQALEMFKARIVKQGQT